MLGREIEIFLRGLSPVLGMFSDIAKQYLFNFIDPYVDAFVFPQTDKINTSAAKEFVKEEVDEKVKSFIEKFEKEKAKNLKDNGPTDYIV